MGARLGLGGGAVLVAILIAVVTRQPKLEDHTQYQEARRILRNDGLEANDNNLRLALRMIDAATQPYSEDKFQVIDPRRWVRGDRPQSTTKQLSDGSSVSLVEVATKDAKVWIIEDLVSETEAAALMNRIGRINFTTSPTNHETGQEWRSSSSSLISRSDPDMQALLQRAAALCSVPLTHLENPQVVRYRPGERYQPHMDSEGAHHRHWTLLLYLNDPGSGGATAFPLLNLKVLPAPRVAVFWENLRAETGHAEQVRNYFTVHDGQPPTGSEPKFAVNLWVRGAPYDPDT